MYTQALKDIFARPDFAEISETELGIYPQLIESAARSAHEQATTISPEAKQYVLDWLKDSYNITME